MNLNAHHLQKVVWHGINFALFMSLITNVTNRPIHICILVCIHWYSNQSQIVWTLLLYFLQLLSVALSLSPFLYIHQPLFDISFISSHLNPQTQSRSSPSLTYPTLYPLPLSINHLSTNIPSFSSTPINNFSLHNYPLSLLVFIS